MKYSFEIFIALILFFFLIKDYRATKNFILHKVLHVFSILIIFTSSSSALPNLLAVIKHYESYHEWNIYSNIDYLPTNIGLSISFLSNLFGFLLYLAAFGLVVRGELSRKVIIWIIPFKIAMGIPLMHYLIFNHQDDLKQTFTTWIAITLQLSYLGFFILYSSNFMKLFFAAKKKIISAGADL